ncbi:AraC-like DNA-binding protein [Streptomyces achromogenes]|uniref:AraC-like DNA-binding protein n=1 Tax=Streptomyces achromogenes TaxID=67255 RepID=A0ABU0QDX6_STRAH|nr:helix-turn-helix domain-containing protein [Streptomyces achromogenes]MDQ0688866.1 AraC-like DNA-binding protein [Streptomyces achromogenes]
MSEPVDRGEYVGGVAQPLRGSVIRYRGHRMAGARPLRVTLPSATVTLLLGWGHPLHVQSGPQDGSSLGEWPAMIAGLQASPLLAGFRGAAFAVEIELSPLGARRLLGTSLHHLAKAVVDPDEILGAGWTREATERLMAAPNWPQRWQILDSLLLPRLAGPPPPPVVAEAWHLLRTRDGAVSLSDLMAVTGLGSRRLQGLFRDHIGLPAQTVSRILRFHRTLGVASSGCGSLAELAVRGGYHDQAHMNRDFRALSGQTPGELCTIMERAPARGHDGHIQPFNDFGLRHQPRRQPGPPAVPAVSAEEGRA